MSEIRYVKSIDSLRAISIVAVIWFHYFQQFKNAGYLGVDIFFVISGFVITASLSNYRKKNSYSELANEFYLRRIKRLLPSLVFCIVVTSILLLLFATRNSDALRTGSLALVGLSNIFLYIRGSDYFALTTELNAFTHMWSLATEDQFYMLFPILVWFLSPNGCNENIKFRYFLLVLAGISAASLLLFIVLFFKDNAFAFYMLPTRAWQICLGAIAYLVVANLRFELRQTTLAIHLLLVALVAVLYFGALNPLGAHVSVTFLTAALLMFIWFDKEQSILRSRLAQYVGKLSYSLYLWHWPILVLSKYTFGISPFSITICLVLTTMAGAFSYHMIENPVRRLELPAEESQQKTVFLQIISVVLAITIASVIALPDLASRNNNLIARHWGVEPVRKTPIDPCNGIQKVENLEAELERCLGGERNESSPRLAYLLGDSHANQLVPVLRSFFTETPFRLNFASYNLENAGIYKLFESAPATAADYEYIIKHSKPGDLVIIAFHRGRLNQFRDSHLRLDVPVRQNSKSKNLLYNLDNIIGRLGEKQVNVLLTRDSPLMASVSTPETCAFQIKLGVTSVCRISKAQDLHTRTRQDQVFNELQLRHNNAHTWDLLEPLYGEQDTFDVLDRNGKYLMSDWNHLTEYGAELLKPYFKAIYEEQCFDC